jgi:hypothetical protein
MRRIRFFSCKRLIDQKILKDVVKLLKAKVHYIFPTHYEDIRGLREENLYILQQNGFQMEPFRPTLQEYIDATIVR